MRSTPYRATFLALGLVLAACPKRTAVVAGQELPIARAEDLARTELAALRAELEARPDDVAATKLEAFASRYRDVPAGAEALHAAARRWRAADKPDRAATALQRLLAEHPLYPA